MFSKIQAALTEYGFNFHTAPLPTEWPDAVVGHSSGIADRITAEPFNCQEFGIGETSFRMSLFNGDYPTALLQSLETGFYFAAIRIYKDTVLLGYVVPNSPDGMNPEDMTNMAGLVCEFEWSYDENAIGTILAGKIEEMAAGELEYWDWEDSWAQELVA